MGLRSTGLLSALLYPLMLTALFYSGPIILWLTNEYCSVYLGEF